MMSSVDSLLSRISSEVAALEGSVGYAWVYLAILVAFVAMGLCVQQLRYSRSGRVLAVVFGSVCILLSVSVIAHSLNERDTGCGGGGTTYGEKAYAQAAYETLGDYLGQTFPGKTIIVVVVDQSTTYDYPMNQWLALQTGLAGRATMQRVEMPAPDESANSSAIYDSFAFTNQSFDAFMAEHVPGYTDATDGDPRDVVIVSLVGLPSDLESLTYWDRPAECRPHLVLSSSPVRGLHDHIASGSIDAVLTHKPDVIYDPDAQVPATRDERFADRYLLVTPDTLTNIAAAHPNIFAE